MNKRQLKSKITKKIETLHELLDNIDEVRAINPDDPETWDGDTLYNLAEQLKEALKLLENQKSKPLNDWGEPIILEEGLCSLIDSYQEKTESKEYE